MAFLLHSGAGIHLERQQGHPRGQGPGVDRGAKRALRRRDGDRPAHGDRLLALLQGIDGEEEGGGDGGGEEAAAARGGEDGRWCRVCQVCHLSQNSFIRIESLYSCFTFENNFVFSSHVLFKIFDDI